MRIVLAELDDAHTGPIAMLRVRPLAENRLHQLRGVRADVGGPLDQPLRGPLQIPLVRGGTMRGIGGIEPPPVEPDMTGDAPAMVQDLDDARGEADVDLRPDEPEGHDVKVMA